MRAGTVVLRHVLKPTLVLAVQVVAVLVLVAVVVAAVFVSVVGFGN